MYVETERREDKGESRVLESALSQPYLVCACDFLIKMSAYNPDNLGLANKIILWDFLFQSSFLWFPSCQKNTPLRKQCQRDDGPFQIQIEYHNE